MPQLILASQSLQRKALIEALGIDFKVVPADIDEKAIQHTDFSTRVRMVAEAKRDTLVKSFPEQPIVSGDSFIELDGLVLEKPQTLEEAKKMLIHQSGRWVTIYTGMAYRDPEKDLTLSEVIIARGLFRKLSHQEIDHYVHNQPVLTWAGGFSPAYPAGATLIAEIEGSLTGFVYGLATEVVVPWLNQSGFDV